MIIKKRDKPLPLKKLEAAIPRLSPRFPRLSKMKKDAESRQKGYDGELEVDYFLEYLAGTHTIIQDVYLRVNGKNVQVDSLLASKHAIHIVDSKNLSGTITFDTHLNQMIRNDGKAEAGNDNPITQVKNQKFHLQNWFTQNNLPNIPIFPFVAISESSTIIKAIGDAQAVGKMVAHGARIPTMIMEEEQQLDGLKNIHDRQIGKMILNACGEFDLDIMKDFGIKSSDLSPGVICPACNMLGMERVYDGWICKKCTCKSRNAHLKAISDYLLLINPYITNKECMRWLCLTSRSTATRLLRNSGLIYQKERKRWVSKYARRL
ncbi:nuclease-related domain-containing protein [Virgibacillus doumboii]|uniref:nuclease-related domain-containing protein n=1 Tax=Virgibacillus doumboii TaxID=2697503 RepID=UPI0013DEF06B|nr:nuclease-related domain-containing protein [Virgibacillus doumboii]